MVPVKGQPPRIAGTEAEGLEHPAREVHRAELPPARIEQPQPLAVAPRGVRHGQAREDGLVTLDIEEQPTPGAMLPPAIGHIATPDRRHVAGHAPLQGQPVEMAAILGGEPGDEGRLPEGVKLWRSLTVARQLNSVLTNSGRPVPSTPMSWISMSPVVQPSWGTYSRS